MMKLLLAVIVSPFVNTTIEDPITQEKRIVFATLTTDAVLSLSCEEGSGSMAINVVPDKYYGAASQLTLWSPSVATRFGSQDKPEAGHWRFGRKELAYSPTGVNRIKRTAQFVDRLARNDVLHFRYEPFRGEVETLTFEYTIDPEMLGAFINRCGPKRLIKYLDEMGSPASTK